LGYCKSLQAIVTAHPNLLTSQVKSNRMLTWVLGPNYGYCDRCSNLKSLAQNTAMAESEGVRLNYFWRFIIYTPTAWSPTIWAWIHAPILGDEMVFAWAYFLWHWSWSIHGMSAHLRRVSFPERQESWPICIVPNSGASSTG
jgi:hypothetical protein